MSTRELRAQLEHLQSEARAHRQHALADEELAGLRRTLAALESRAATLPARRDDLRLELATVEHQTREAQAQAAAARDAIARLEHLGPSVDVKAGSGLQQRWWSFGSAFLLAVLLSSMTLLVFRCR